MLPAARTIVLFLALAPVPLGAGSAVAATKEERERCDALADLRVENVNTLSARVIAPMEKGLPETCRVLGYVRPAINFELHLPVKGWNEKFFMAGCDGFCGRVALGSGAAQNSVRYALSRRYAAVAMDGGHWGPDESSALWAYNAIQAEIDFGRRSAPAVAVASKAVIDAFYAEDLRFSYFAGCGNGGRQGVMATVTHPDLFDGVIAGAPMVRMTETLGTRAAWFDQALRDPAGDRLIGAEESDLVAREVYRFCDAKDGVADGLISSPMSCGFDPRSLACNGVAAGDDPGPSCLAPSKIDALELLYERPRNAVDNRLAVSGQIPGAEPFWATWITGDLESEGMLRRLGREFLRYLAFEPDPGPTYRLEDFFMDRDPDEMATMGEILDVPVDDRIADFGEQGGRLILYHGWADAAVSPLGSVEFLREAERVAAKGEAWASLYLVPGMGHCAVDASRGPDQFDLLTVLEGWVEQGAEPGPVTASEVSETGETVRSRLLCPYPRRAAFRGEDPAKAGAKDFRCVAGEPVRLLNGD